LDEDCARVEIGLIIFIGHKARFSILPIIRKVIILSFFILITFSPTSYASYSSIAQALSSGDVSAASRMISANKGVSPSSMKQFALADALTSGNTQRVQQIITGSTLSPNSNLANAQLQTREIANAMTSGNMDKVAEVVFGQDAVVANALARGDVSAASKAIQQGKSIDRYISSIITQPSSGTPQPSSGTPQPSSGTPQPSSGTPQPSSGTPQPSSGTPQPSSGTPQPSSGTPQPSSGTPQEAQLRYEQCVNTVKASNESAVCKDPYGQFLWTKSNKDKINELVLFQPELEDKKFDLALVIDLFTQSFEQNISRLNNKDRNRINNNSSVKYFFSIIKEYKISFERNNYDQLLKIRNDENFVNSLYFTQSYEVKKLFYVNSKFKELSNSIMNLIPKYQCEKKASNSLVALDSKGVCLKGYKKVEV
jgi:hypothetical protein